jgi:hypothetical protein
MTIQTIESILATRQQGFILATVQPCRLSIHSGNTATRIYSSNITAIQTLESILAARQQGFILATWWPYRLSIHSGNKATRIHSSNVRAIQTRIYSGNKDSFQQHYGHTDSRIYSGNTATRIYSSNSMTIQTLESILATRQQGFILATLRPYRLSIHSGNTATRIHSSNITAIQTLNPFWQHGNKDSF